MRGNYFPSFNCEKNMKKLLLPLIVSSVLSSNAFAFSESVHISEPSFHETSVETPAVHSYSSSDEDAVIHAAHSNLSTTTRNIVVANNSNAVQSQHVVSTSTCNDDKSNSIINDIILGFLLFLCLILAYIVFLG